MIENEEEAKSGSNENEKPKSRMPGEGDVISGGGLSQGKKFVVEDLIEETPGVKSVTVRKLASDGSFDPSIKKEKFVIIDEAKTLKADSIKFHNKMKKKFVKKGEV